MKIPNFLQRRLSAACIAAVLAAASPHIYAAKATTGKAKMRKVSAVAEPAGEFANFSEWKDVSAFIDAMSIKHAFDKNELNALFRKVRYVASAVRFIKPPAPGRPKNWQAYRARFVEPVRIRAGLQFWNDHAQTLERAELAYGVPAEIIVGIIGVETIYGRNTGNFRVLDAVTTLAFDYPATPNREARMAFFRGELEHTLLLARDAGLDPFALQGSYAGAIGWPQFMPGSIRQFAVDFDGDGKIDLRNSPIDAIGSVANFLVQHGWQRGEPLVFPATVTTVRNENGGDSKWESFVGQGLEAKFRLDELRAAGIAPGIEPPADLAYGLVDLQNGQEATEYWLGAANFFSITKYNRSFFYAMSVIELGRAVRESRNR